MAEPFLDVVDLHKQYGTTLALAGVSFQVQRGEIFGLLGPNGAGKTTLMSILSSLLEPTRGGVRFLGRVFERDDRELKRAIGIVPQDLAIYNELTARENLRFFGALYGLGGRNLERSLDAILDAVGLLDRGRQRAGTFSGGMKRRLSLGAALVHEPKLLLLDEPTTGVDPQSRNHIFEEVRRLNRQGMTIIYTSHYMEEVEALCPRLGIIDHGKLIACDTLPRLLQILPGRIRFRVAVLPDRLRRRLQDLPDTRLVEQDSQPLALECRDP